MSKNDTNTKKLTLRRESLRELTTADLEKVAGVYCASHTPGECPPASCDRHRQGIVR
jgi:hypothetical protein